MESSLIFLLAIMANAIIDYFVYRRITEMRTEYRIIKTQTIEFSGMTKQIAERMPKLLEQHAHATAKAVGGMLGYYQGKGQKATGENIDGVNEIVEKLGPLGDILKAAQQNGGGNAGSGGFHL